MQNIEFNHRKESCKDAFFVKAIIRNPWKFKGYDPYLYRDGRRLVPMLKEESSKES